MEELRKRVLGYSSHGVWSTLGRIREVELERGNRFPELEYPDETPAIWVCKTAREALRYLLPADEWETDSEDGLEDVEEIPLLKSDKVVHEDPDGGYLLLRVKTQMPENKQVRIMTPMSEEELRERRRK